MKKLGERGFSITEILIVMLVLVVIGAAGYGVYLHNNKHSDTVSVSKANTKSTLTLTHTLTTLKIPELGIELVNIPASLTGLTYTIGTDQGFIYGRHAEFSTESLSKLDPNCIGQVGGLGEYTGIYNANTMDNTNYFQYVKQFTSFWIGSGASNVACSTNTTTEQLHVSQELSFTKLVSNPVNLLRL